MRVLALIASVNELISYKLKLQHMYSLHERQSLAAARRTSPRTVSHIAIKLAPGPEAYISRGAP